MYESPLTLNEWKIEANSLDQAIKDTAESVGEKFDRYVLHVISETGITVDRDDLPPQASVWLLSADEQTMSNAEYSNVVNPD